MAMRKMNLGKDGIMFLLLAAIGISMITEAEEETLEGDAAASAAIIM